MIRQAALAGALLASAGPASAAEVSLNGLGAAERANVEARLQILKYAREGGSDEAQLRRLHRLAPEDIRVALQPFGYYSPLVRGSFTGTGERARAHYDIDPGPPTRIATARIEMTGEGADSPELYQRMARHPLREGAHLRHADYEGFKDEMLRAAWERGYLDATWARHELRVEVSRQRATIDLLLDTGPRFYFGAVTLQQEKLEDAFLRRYVPIQPGEPFAPQRLLDAQFALSDLGYFGEVEVLPQRESLQDGNQVPILIRLAPRPPGRYEIGLGYGTDTGARATLGMEFRRLTTTGHKLRTDLRVSEVKKSLGAEYRIPLGNEAAENLGFTGGYTDENFDDARSFRYDLGTYLARTPGDWQRRLYLNYRLERSFVGSEVDTALQLTPGVSLSRGESDDPIHARQGWYMFLDLHGAWDRALSDTSFLQGRAQLRFVQPLGTRGRLLLRTDQGASWVDEFSVLPLSERFFAGGDQSVRGYSYRSLGPRNAEGVVVGGKFLSTYSAEAELRLWDSWGAAVFADAGNAADEPGSDLALGAGAGLRYRAPIGTLQLDLAHPFEGEQRGVRLHLGIRVGL